MEYHVAANVLSLDHETGHLFWKENVSASARKGARAGYVDIATGYRLVRYRGRSYPEHHIVWLLTHGVMPAGFLDHRNRDRSDNRSTNLREATATENTQNVLAQKNSKTGIRGVYWSSQHQKWKAQISVFGRRLFIGSFDDLNEAAQARARAEKQYFGEFAPN